MGKGERVVRGERGGARGKRRTRRVSLSSEAAEEKHGGDGLVGARGRKTRVGAPKEGTRHKIAAGVGEGVGHVAPRRAVPAPTSRTPRVRLSSTSTPGTQRPNRLAGWLTG